MNDSLWQVLSPYIQYPKSVKDDIAVSNELSFKPFDPNAISRDTLVAWGLSEDVAERWVRFREGGKVFKNSEDLLDVFGMVQEWVDHMAPLAQWPAEKTVEQDSVTETVHRKVRKVEINSADSLSLIQVPGIGGYTASKILKLREEMGGFYTLSQIREIYGLRPENFELISKYTFVDRTFIRQININSAPIEEMASHPYISESVAREIEKFRVEFRSFERLDEIQKLYAVDSALYEKIKPYLTLQSK
jgi:DNA uptake protein ComE-like DNA-binding protein